MQLKQTLTRQPFFVFHGAAVIFLWVFVWRHAYTMDISYDEACSFQILQAGNYRALPGVANTHWLNSFCMRLMMFFNTSLLGIRLHAVIAFPFFAHGVYRLASLIKGDVAKFAFYVLALFNPYVLDFFALARGYGLALTFQVWTVLFFINAVNTDFNFRRWMKVFILGACMLASNLSYQYTVMAMAAGFIGYCMITGTPFSWFTNKQKRTITLLFTALLILTTADLLFIKYVGRDLAFGGKENFFQSVFNSFWVQSLYQSNYTYLSTLLSWGTLVMIIISCIYFGIKTFQQRKLNTGIIAAYLIGSILLSGIIFHWFFDTPFMSNRTALQWYLPGLFIIFLAMGEWRLQINGYRIVRYGLGMVIGAAAIFHFVRNYKSHLCMEYSFEVYTRQPVYDLYAQHPQHPNISYWLAGTYKCYYSLVDSLTPKAGWFKEYPDRPLSDKARQTLLASDYIVTRMAATIQYLDSAQIPYTVIKEYQGSPYKILKLHNNTQSKLQ